MHKLWVFLTTAHFGLPTWAWVLPVVFLGLAIAVSLIQKRKKEKEEGLLDLGRFSGYKSSAEHRPGTEVMLEQVKTRAAERVERAELRAKVGATKASQIMAKKAVADSHTESKTWKHFHSAVDASPSPKVKKNS